MNTKYVLEENRITPIEESVFFEDLDERLVGYRECYVDIAPPIPEHEPRRRRYEAFIETPGLTEVLQITPKHREIMQLIRYCVDHISFWTFEGAPIVMTEPYMRVLSDFEFEGISAVQVPERIAPYSGLGRDYLQPRPRTRSFLACRAIHTKRLEKLLKFLEAAAEELPEYGYDEVDRARQ